MQASLHFNTSAYWHCRDMLEEVLERAAPQHIQHM